MKDGSNQRWDSYYDQNRDFGLITSQVLTKLLSYVDPELEKTCLDLGCGTGQLTRELFHRGYSCLGIDSSESAIRIARSLTDQTSRLEYRQGDIEQLSSKDLPCLSYSLITCKLVYAFVEDKPAFLKRVAHVLGDKGIFAIITPLDTDVPSHKQAIAVNEQQLMTELRDVFEVVGTQEVAQGLLVVCRRETLA